MTYMLFVVFVKLRILKGNASWENTDKIICLTAWNLLPKKRVLENQKKYSIMGATNKKELLSRCSEKLERARLVELCIIQFNRKIREGPYFICTVCYWILYKKSAITYINKKYPCQKYFSIQQSFDRKHYICRTCHSMGIKGKLPCQAVVNNMHVDEIPRELQYLH